MSAAVSVVNEEELQGLIFDCDGTLVDTMPAYWKSWVEVTGHYGLKLTKRRFYSLAGVPVRDIFEMLIKEADHLDVKPNIEEVLALKKVVGERCVKEVGTPLIECVVDIARKYHKKIPMAVASSGDRSHVLHSLESNGILHLFDAVVTADDMRGRPSKPAPDIFLEAASRISCSPSKCRGFEDADLGMMGLRAAGMEAIDVRLFEKYPHPVFEEEE